jgi:photosystem II stability/assembly factor-like uncharacterized protein
MQAPPGPKRLSCQFTSRNPGRLIDDVEFANRTTGWLLGTHFVQNLRRFELGLTRGREGSNYGEITVPVVFFTGDGGKSWQRQSYPDEYNEYGWLESADSSHVLIVELNDLVVTVNGGRTWKRTKLDPSCSGGEHLQYAEHGSDTWSGTSVHFLNDGKNAWWGNEGDLFHSTDGGQTWCQLPSLVQQGKVIVFGLLRFSDSRRGWGIPRNLGLDKPLPLYGTRDGGAHWEPLRPIQATEPPPVCGMSVLDAEHVWVWDCDQNLYRVVP